MAANIDRETSAQIIKMVKVLASPGWVNNTDQR